ncbi:hypothetical protein PIB30_030328 [Stylosanthes scabra]|uniref:Uncharacterized protein n=1 Tax=Stylosanthes scabra TaxID=79078 RepID=A0ABU6TBR9_9FABA|nr:hypothetical protein [Stylosanthes scabra]
MTECVRSGDEAWRELQREIHERGREDMQLPPLSVMLRRRWGEKGQRRTRTDWHGGGMSSKAAVLTNLMEEGGNGVRARYLGARRKPKKKHLPRFEHGDAEGEDRSMIDGGDTVRRPSTSPWWGYPWRRGFHGSTTTGTERGAFLPSNCDSDDKV